MWRKRERVVLKLCLSRKLSSGEHCANVHRELHRRRVEIYLNEVLSFPNWLWKSFLVNSQSSPLRRACLLTAQDFIILSVLSLFICMAVRLSDFNEICLDECLASKLAVEKLSGESCPSRRAQLIIAQDFLFSLCVSIFIWLTVCISDFLGRSTCAKCLATRIASKHFSRVLIFVVEVWGLPYQ